MASRQLKTLVSFSAKKGHISFFLKSSFLKQVSKYLFQSVIFDMIAYNE